MDETDLIKQFESVPTIKLFRTLWDKVQVDFGSLKKLLEAEPAKIPNHELSDIVVLLTSYSELYGYICEKGRKHNPYESIEVIERSDEEKKVDVDFLYTPKGYLETYQHYLTALLPTYGREYFAYIKYDLIEPLSRLRTSVYLISKVTHEDKVIPHVEKAVKHIQKLEAIINAAADYEKQLFD